MMVDAVRPAPEVLSVYTYTTFLRKWQPFPSAARGFSFAMRNNYNAILPLYARNAPRIPVASA